MFRRVLVSVSFLGLSLSGGANAATPSPRKPAQVSKINNPISRVTAKVEIKAPKKIASNVAVASSLLLAFNSGYINGCCLSGGLVDGVTKQAVSAVTGAWTTSALGFAAGTKAFPTQMKAIASYFGGSAIAGVMIPKPVAFQLAGNTGLAFLVGAAILYLASNLAGSDPSSMTPFYLALIANGLQNSITSVHTANLCRTAHFSGITSDMGTFVGQCLMGNRANLFKLKVFAALAASFWVGGVSSYYATQEMSNGSLLFSAALYLLIGSGLILKA